MFGFCLFVINNNFFKSLNLKQQNKILDISLKALNFKEIWQ